MSDDLFVLRSLTVEGEALVRGTREMYDLVAHASASLDAVLRKAEAMHRSACKLLESGALVGSAHAEATHAVQYWAKARDLVAECIVAVVYSTSHQTIGPAIVKAAQCGATEHLLASWEAEWLREAAVTALAGTDK